MEKKKFSIELPKGGMSDLTKQVRNSPITEPPADATEWQRFTRYLDEFKNVSEHGECVWLFKDVKREIERIKFESDAKLNSKCHAPCIHQGTRQRFEEHSFWLIVK